MFKLTNSIRHSRLHRMLAGILTTVLCTLSTAQAADLEAIQAALGRVKTIQADFQQEKHIPILQKPLLSHGRFYFMAPRAMRWEYRQPLQSLTILYQGRLTRWQPAPDGGLQPVSGDAAALQHVFNDMLNWLGGRFTEGDMFSVTLYDKGHIRLTPRRSAMEAFISHIDIYLSATMDYVKSVVIDEGEHGHTRIEFHDVIVNAPVDTAQFEPGGR